MLYVPSSVIDWHSYQSKGFSHFDSLPVSRAFCPLNHGKNHV